MLVILADMDQKDSYCGMYKAGYAGCDAPRAVIVSLVLRMAGMTRRVLCRLPFRAAKTALHGPALSEDH